MTASRPETTYGLKGQYKQCIGGGIYFFCMYAVFSENDY